MNVLGIVSICFSIVITIISAIVIFRFTKARKILENKVTTYEREIEDLQRNSKLEKRKIENSVMRYILEQADTNAVRLAKKDKRTYINFSDKRLSKFLDEWFSVLKIYQTEGMSNDMYKVFITTYNLTINEEEENKEP